MFKMRTAPLVTAPRYQEDYVLAQQQLKAMDLVHQQNRAVASALVQQRLRHVQLAALAVSVLAAGVAVVYPTALLRIRDSFARLFSFSASAGSKDSTVV